MQWNMTRNCPICSKNIMRRTEIYLYITIFFIHVYAWCLFKNKSSVVEYTTSPRMQTVQINTLFCLVCTYRWCVVCTSLYTCTFITPWWNFTQGVLSSVKPVHPSVLSVHPSTVTSQECPKSIRSFWNLAYTCILVVRRHLSQVGLIRSILVLI